jgi:hypothetical protein
MANKLLIYKIILKPIRTYGIELWGCSKPSNTKVLQTFQSKMGARGSVVVKALCCKPEIAGSSPDEVDFLN